MKRENPQKKRKGDGIVRPHKNKKTSSPKGSNLKTKTDLSKKSIQTFHDKVKATNTPNKATEQRYYVVESINFGRYGLPSELAYSIFREVSKSRKVGDND